MKVAKKRVVLLWATYEHDDPKHKWRIAMLSNLRCSRQKRFKWIGDR